MGLLLYLSRSQSQSQPFFVFRHHSGPITSTSTYPSCPWPFSHKQPRSCIYFTDRLPVSCGSRQHGGLCCPFEATHAWHSITSLTRTCLCFEYRIVDVRFPIIIPYGYHANLLRPLVTSPGSFASLLYCWLHPENSKITQNISFRLSHINPSPPCLTVLVPFLVDSLYAIAA